LSPLLARVRERVEREVDPSTVLATALGAIVDKDDEASDCYFLVGDTEGDGQGRRIHAHAIVWPCGAHA
jgi:hypothetical protein